MTDSELGSLLVVDDNEMNRDMLSRRLERRGYDVAVAIDGAQAIDLLQQRRFDAILLDIMMPGISGWDVLKWIRERHSRSQLPVIMATARDSSDDVVEALKLGANDYVTKPLDMKVVLARVGTHVILKRTTESLERTNQQLQAANDRLKSDLEAAANVQQSQLPSKSLRLEGCEVAWAYKPCDELAGDFLNIFDFDEQHVGLYLLDVSGHGVPAALMSVAVSRALKPSLDETCVISKPNRSRSTGENSLQISSPSKVADKLNERFPSDPRIGQYFTLIYGILDKSSRQLLFTSAGHPRPVLIRANGDEKLVDVDPGFPIGLFQANDPAYEPYPEMALTLNPGDRICFYSDGVPEATNTEDEQFGEERMLSSLAVSAHSPLDKCVSSLLDAVLAWTAPRSPSDDVSILALEMQD